MMNVRQWQHALQIQIPGLRVVLKNISGQAYSIDLQNTGSISAEEAVQEIQKAEMIAQFTENNFQSNVSLGFDGNWNTLADFLAEGNSQGKQNKEIGQDLIKTFSASALEVITLALAETGIEIETGQIDITPKTPDFKENKYFSACLEVIPDTESKDKQAKPPALKLWVVLSCPDEEELASHEEKFETDSPFTDDSYSEFMVRFARQMSPINDEPDSEANEESTPKKEQKVEFEKFTESKIQKNDKKVRNIDFLENVDLHVSVELGQRKMPLIDVLKLVKGSVIELEKLAGEPVEILVNGHKIAQGDVMVVDEYFGVRISNLLTSQEQIKKLT